MTRQLHLICNFEIPKKFKNVLPLINVIKKNMNVFLRNGRGRRRKVYLKYFSIREIRFTRGWSSFEPAAYIGNRSENKFIRFYFWKIIPYVDCSSTCHLHLNSSLKTMPVNLIWQIVQSPVKINECAITVTKNSNLFLIYVWPRYFRLSFLHYDHL